jgi:hypothetical protein
MNPEFNEFQYGYSVTSELERRFRRYLLMPPIIPSLVEEGNVAYDAQIPLIGFPIFLQYKLSHYLTRRNARQWKYYNSRYYRFKIWPANVSNQHNELVALSQSQLYVFYCSPVFYKKIDYISYHMSNQICQNSNFIPCSALPRIFGKTKHNICYDRNGNNIRFFSEPKKLPNIDIYSYFKKLQKKERGMKIDQGFPYELLYLIKKSIYDSIENDYDNFSEKKQKMYNHYFKILEEIKSPWDKLSLLTNVFMGISWFVLLKY